MRWICLFYLLTTLLVQLGCTATNPAYREATQPDQEWVIADASVLEQGTYAADIATMAIADLAPLPDLLKPADLAPLPCGVLYGRCCLAPGEVGTCGPGLACAIVFDVSGNYYECR